MAKGKSTWKYNKLLTPRRNYYTNGGTYLGIQSLSPNDAKIIDNKLGTSVPLGKSLVAGLQGITRDALGSGLGGIAMATGNVIGNAIGSGYNSGIGDTLNNAGLGFLGGIANRAFGAKMNEENIAKVENNIKELNNFQSNAMTYDDLSQNWANAATGMTFDDSFIGSNGWFNNKASDKADDLRKQIASGVNRVQGTLNNNADNIGITQMQNLLGNYAALGGNLMTHGSDFNTKLNLIGNGGTHESNPNEGVLMGVDPQGIPNLVEEGEVIFNDYVFSNRLKVPKSIRNKYKLRGNKSITFAEAALQLGKESKERPNDPISKAGLDNSMAKLIAEQEQIRMKKEGIQAVQQYAEGGKLSNLFPTGSWMQTLNRNNYTPNLNFGVEGFNPYMEGTNQIDFNIMYGDNSPYMKRRNYVLNNWDNDGVKKWRTSYIKAVNDYNKDRVGFTPLTEEGLTKDIFSSRTYDRNWGGMHAGLLSVNPLSTATSDTPITPRKTGKRMYLTGRTDASGTPLEDLLIPDYDPNTGTYQYVRTANNSVGDTDYTDIYYKARSAKEEKEENKDLGTPGEYPDYDNWLRYVPVVGAAIGLGNSLFSSPDYSDADAIMQATAKYGQFSPVTYNPVGNYLSFKPLDRDYYINKYNAQLAASRRALLNTSGQNRGTAMAGILASDYNGINSIGDMIMKQELFNREQEQKVEEFNRGTNAMNSEGFLKADMANQQTRMGIGELALRGIMAASELRNKERLARENALSVNATNLFDSLGDIGREKVDRAWRTWAAEHGVYAPVQNEENMASKGGKLKKKKGLTI